MSHKIAQYLTSVNTVSFWGCLAIAQLSLQAKRGNLIAKLKPTIVGLRNLPYRLLRLVPSEASELASQ
jgi:hypothetical protein